MRPRAEVAQLARVVALAVVAVVAAQDGVRPADVASDPRRRRPVMSHRPPCSLDSKYHDNKRLRRKEPSCARSPLLYGCSPRWRRCSPRQPPHRSRDRSPGRVDEVRWQRRSSSAHRRDPRRPRRARRPASTVARTLRVRCDHLGLSLRRRSLPNRRRRPQCRLVAPRIGGGSQLTRC